MSSQKLKPFVLILCCWVGLSSLAVAGQKSSVNYIPAFLRSDQGLLLSSGHNLLLLEGTGADEVWWLGMQLGTETVISALYSNFLYLVNPYSFSNNTAAYASQRSRMWLYKTVNLGLTVREIVKAYQETGLWSAFLGRVPYYALSYCEDHDLPLLVYTGVGGALLAGKEAYRRLVFPSPPARRTLSLSGSDASYLLAYIDFDGAQKPGASRLVLSRVYGHMLPEKDSSAMVRLSRFMDSADIRSLYFDLVPGTKTENSYFVVTSTPDRQAVHFNIDDPENCWLENRLHQQQSASEWIGSRSVLSPGILNTVVDSLMTHVPKQPGNNAYTDLVNKQNGDTLRVNISHVGDIKGVKRLEDDLFSLGDGYNLKINKWTGLELKTPVSEKQPDYIQYRLPREYSHFLMTITSILGRSIVHNRVIKAMEHANSAKPRVDVLAKEYDNTSIKVFRQRYRNKESWGQDNLMEKIIYNFDECWPD